MTNVQEFIENQLGLYYKWNKCYDSAVKRLRCSVLDNYHYPLIDNATIAESPVFASKFAQTQGYKHILALANEDGEILIHNTESAAQQRCEEARQADVFSKMAHTNAIFDLEWLFGQMKLISVSGDHTARLHSVTENDIVEERIFHGHTRSVKTVACRKDDPAVFATGARDGAIFIWDSRANFSLSYVTQPDRIIANSHNIPDTPGSGNKFRKKHSGMVSGANSVTGLVFQNDMTLVSCGAGDGTIKFWDLRKSYGNNKREPLPKNIIPYSGTTTRNGFSNLLVNQSGIRLFASCMDNTIYCYNIGTYHPKPIMLYKGHQNSTFYVKASLTCDENYLVSGSGDKNAYIWRTDQSEPLVRLEGHTAEVTCVSWCEDATLKLVTCADDMCSKIWRIHFENDDLISCGEAVEINKPKATNNRTPSSSKKRMMNRTPHSQRKKAKICQQCQMLTPGSTASLLNCENCVFVGRSNKRSAGQANLSSDETPEEKRQNVDRNGGGGARRLFSTAQEIPSSRDDGVLAVILEETSPNKNNNTSFSLTANLPNFVIDGEAPHLKNFSPQKKQDKDWLTKIRIEQSLRNQMQELSRPSSPKQMRLDSGCSGKKKKSSTTTSPIQSPLLKFFRVTNSSKTSTTCEQSCSDFRNLNHNSPVATND